MISVGFVYDYSFRLYPLGVSCQASNMSHWLKQKTPEERVLFVWLGLVDIFQTFVPTDSESVMRQKLACRFQPLLACPALSQLSDGWHLSVCRHHLLMLVVLLRDLSGSAQFRLANGGSHAREFSSVVQAFLRSPLRRILYQKDLKSLFDWKRLRQEIQSRRVRAGLRLLVVASSRRRSSNLLFLLASRWFHRSFYFKLL
jgi:hypothetical protein